ncbi:MAG TPA: cation:proton antiporter [Bacteroidales bacterium]|nr:cation:proton antiporter [Bacteroidales bacterium]
MLHLPALIIDLAIILGSAALVTLLFKKLKQPVVLGYIISGFLVGPHIKLLPTGVEADNIQIWADIGVIFLLFGLGLDFSFKKLMKVGHMASITAMTEVTLTMLLGYCIGKILNWNDMDSLFLGGILAISSTTIIIRAFDELGVKNQKFAGLVTGVLVIEDLVAVLLLVLLSTISVKKTFAGGEMFYSIIKLFFFLVLWFVSGIFFLPTFLKKIRKLLNDETLLIISLALCFSMVVLAADYGFSPALGAFIMGSVLAETTKAEKIEYITKSVKNLFGAIFFVSIGMLLDPQMLGKNIVPVIAATLVLLVGKPIFVIFGAILSGQPLKTAIQTGMSLSQIGEFSFIIATLGLTLKVTSSFLYPVAVAVSVLTTFFTPYMIRFSRPAGKLIEFLLPQKWKSALDRYSVSAQNISEISDWKKVLRASFVNIIIFSVVIITIILLSTRYIEPLFFVHKFSRIFTAIITLIFLSPFLWALAFRRTQRQAYANVWQKTSLRGPLLVLQLSRIVLAVLFTGFLFYMLFSPWIALAGVCASIIILIVFSSKIKFFYRKIETRFMLNLNDREILSKPSDEVLTSWDSHITTFVLNEQSMLAGRSLSELKIREKFGVNIVMIERGELVINIPGRETRIFPYDKLTVIGTDAQLEKFNAFLETSTVDNLSTGNKPKVSLYHFSIGDNSVLINKNIRESKIREQTQGLVIGIERKGKQLLNPESDVVFELNDKVWLVGNEKQILAGVKKFTGQTYPFQQI